MVASLCCRADSTYLLVAGVPISFITTYSAGEITWDPRIQWVTDIINPPFNHTFYPRGGYRVPSGLFAETSVPWRSTWLDTIVSLDGEQMAKFPISNISVNFTRSVLRPRLAA